MNTLKSHKFNHRLTQLIFICFMTLILTACGLSQASQPNLSVVINQVESQNTISVPSGSSVAEAYEIAGISLNPLDKSSPSLSALVEDGMQIHLTRVTEEYYQEDQIIPFESQTIRNESLPEGEQRLIQPGVNGLLEVTYRRILEDGVEVSNTLVENAIITQAVPEIIMVGSQTPFSIIPIPGKLAYLSAGNAWIMEGDTGSRRPVVTSGDLDGHIFSISPDHVWLLYTRSDQDEEIINTLWVTRIDGEEELSFDLGVSNVIHFAEWIPETINGIAYSTVDPNPSPPGWQANNDLVFLNFSVNGWVSQPRVILAGSSGGIYGWWGTNFVWSPDAEELAYARPDGIGLVGFDIKTIESSYELIPLQTRSDWAWVPVVSWSPDSLFLYTVDHAPQEGVTTVEQSSAFDLLVIPMFRASPISMIENVGMFASPIPSPQFILPNGENGYLIAYLQSENPAQSATSDYQLMLMDRDGSNQQILFPDEVGGSGIDPQEIIWAPLPILSEDDDEALSYQPMIAFKHHNNLWIYNVTTQTAQQITGDGLTDALDWE